MGPGKRHTGMDMLRKPRARRGKEEQTGHAELGHDVTGFSLPLEAHGHALSKSLGRREHGTDIPIPFGKTLANDIGSTNPGIHQRRSRQASMDLSGNHFSLGKFRHGVIRPSGPEKRQWALSQLALGSWRICWTCLIVSWIFGSGQAAGRRVMMS